MRLSKRFDKTITIPVRIQDGQVTFLYSHRFPPLLDGVEGKLIVPEDAIADKRWKTLLSLPVIVELLPANTVIGIAVKCDHVWDAKELGWLDNDFKPWQAVTYDELTGEIKEGLILESRYISVMSSFLTKRLRSPYYYFLVKVCLQEPLRLELRGTSKPRLLDCRCHIPALKADEKQFADSLNEAYTRISEVFEPTRRSHTGNIFLLCAVKLPKGWTLLDNLRSICEAEYEQWLQEQLSKIEAMPKLEKCQKEVAQRIQERLAELFS